MLAAIRPQGREGVWALPKGKIDAGESPAETAVREVREETGVEGRLAEERLEPGPWAYLAGGSGDEWTLRENRAAFERWTFRPRVLCDVSEISTATSVLDTRLELPVILAPVAYQELFHGDGEC